MFVIDAIVRSYLEGEKEAVRKVKETFFPSNWAKILECIEERPIKKTIIRGSWHVYEGRLDAHLLKGSYNFSSGEFMGSLSTPFVDTQSSHPGPEWTLLNAPPAKSALKPIRGLFIMSGGNAKESLLEQLGPRQMALQETDQSLMNPV